MKKLFLVLMFFAVCQAALPITFDVILTSDRKQVQCNIIEVLQSQVSYLLYNNEDQHVYELPAKDILKVYMRDGAVYGQNTENGETVIVMISGPKEEAPKETVAIQQDNKKEIEEAERKLKEAEAAIALAEQKAAEAEAKRLEAERRAQELDVAARSANPDPVPSYASSARVDFPGGSVSSAGGQTTVDYPGGGKKVYADGSARVDFPGGHKTTNADGSTTIEVPFVTINTGPKGGKGAQIPYSDDIAGFEVLKFSGETDEHVVVINKSKRADCFKVAVYVLINNYQVWRIALTGREIVPQTPQNEKQRDLWRSKTENELQEQMPSFDHFVYAVAVMSRSGEQYSYHVYNNRGDLVIEVYDKNSTKSDW